MRVLRAQRLHTTVSCALASATALLLLVVLLTFAVHAVASDGGGGDAAAGAATAPEAVMSGVTELTEVNFDSLVGKRRAAFVEFYAPWCGHCKRLARDMAMLGRVAQQAAAAASAEHAKEDGSNNNSTRGDGSRRGKAKKPLASRLLIGKVDATAQSALAERFAIRSFPTLLYFAPSSAAAAAAGGRPEEYRGGRSVEDMVRYLDAKVGAHNNNNAAGGAGGEGVDGAGALLTQLRALAPDEVHRARELTAVDFAHVVGNTSTSTLILFYAPWCAHCAALKPVYNALTSIFARNDDVVIARLDATAPAHAAVVAPYKVSSFPTLYLVPHGNTARARRYRGTSRSLEALVQFVNDVTVMPRLADGSVSVHYGTDAALRKQLVQLHRALCNSKGNGSSGGSGGGGGGGDVDDDAVVAAARRVKDGAARWRDVRVSQYYAYLADVLLSLAHNNNSTVATTSGDDDSGNSNATASAPHRLTGAAMTRAWRTWLLQALAQLRDAADDAHASAARDEAQIRVNILQYLKEVL